MILLHFLFAVLSIAKPVTLEWDAMDQAISYEIEIRPQNGNSLFFSLNQRVWNGELDFGVYTYRVRAVDKLNRPGNWSSTQKLVVLSPAPKLNSPEDGAELSMAGNSSEVVLSWKPTEGASKYVVSIYQNGKLISTSTVGENSFRTKALNSGTYEWEVKAVLESNQVAGRWESQSSGRNSFQLNSGQVGEMQSGIQSPNWNRTYIGFGLGQSNQVFSNAFGKESKISFQVIKQLRPDFSYGAMLGFGYNSVIITQNIALSAFIEAAPQKWIASFRGYINAIEFEDRGGKSINPPFNGSNRIGFGPGVSVGVPVFKSRSFKIVPELRYDIYRMETNPSTLSLTINFIGSLI